MYANNYYDIILYQFENKIRLQCNLCKNTTPHFITATNTVAIATMQTNNIHVQTV